MAGGLLSREEIMMDNEEQKVNTQREKAVFQHQYICFHPHTLTRKVFNEVSGVNSNSTSVLTSQVS